MPSKIHVPIPVQQTKETPIASDKKTPNTSEKKKQLKLGSFFAKNTNVERKTPTREKEIVLIDVSDEDEVKVINNISTVNVKEKNRKGEKTQCNMFTDSGSGLNLNVIEDQSQTDGSSNEPKKEGRNLLLSIDAEYSNSSFSDSKTTDTDKPENEPDDEVPKPIDVDKDDSSENQKVQEKYSSFNEGNDHEENSGNKDSLPDQKNSQLESEFDEKRETKVNDLATEAAENNQYCLNLNQQCESKLKELVELGREEKMDQDLENLEDLLKDMPCCSGEDGSFPDTLLPYLACIVQGSNLPLSILSSRACKFLCTVVPKLSQSSIENKIKVLANRKAYLGNSTKLEDNSPDMMWRWEVIGYDLFPQNNSLIQRVKKRKAYRGKMRIWYNAVHRIKKAINKFLKARDEDIELKSSVILQVKEEEKKLRKLEEEKEKSSQRAQAKNLERIEKENLLKERQRLKEATQKDREAEKQQAKKLKEEEKEQTRLLKEKEKELAKKLKEEQLEKERKTKETKILKNKQRMLSFFSKPAKASSASSTIPSADPKALHPNNKPSTTSSPNFDSVAFRSKINSSTSNFPQPLFSTLSTIARKSRRKRTKSVEVTIESTGTVSPTQLQPCIELRVISVPNKYKFLKFFEDHRPPYCGTWCKKSSVISGKCPFEKDTKFLDYEYDSEAEWEEEEPGEDLEEEEQIDDADDDMEQLEAEEGGTIHDTRTYNFEDGWMVSDDNIDYSDEEDTAKAVLRREKNTKKDFTSTSLLIVPPLQGGLPPLSTYNTEAIVEGNGKNAIKEAKQIFQDLKCEILLRETEEVPSLISLDLFPPYVEAQTNKIDNISKTGDIKNNSSSNVKKTSLTTNELKLFARFIHNNELNSRDKLLEELLLKFQECKLQVPTRATAYRTLIAKAEKKKVSTCSGVVIFWEVKKETLQELGLSDLLHTKPANLIAAEKKAEEKAKRKAELEKKAEAKRIEMEEKAKRKAELERKAEAKRTEMEKKAAVKRKAEKDAAIDRLIKKCNNSSSKTETTPSSAEKKRKDPEISKASTSLFGAYFKKKKTSG